MVASETRKDCLSTDHRCWSPLACSTFGYCRVRNFSEPYDPNTDAKWSWADAIEAIHDRRNSV